MKTSRLLALALGALCALLAPALHAQDALIQPTAISSSTSGTDAFPVARLIDGSGLSGAPTLAALGTHDPASSTTAWVTDANTLDYYGALPAPVLTCTLPGLHSVSELVIWGYHFGAANANEGKTFDVAFSTDGSTFAHTVTVTSPAPLASGALRLPLPGPLRVATHVRVSITDNHFGAAPGGDRVGLGELRFAGQPAIVVTNPSDSGPGSLRAAIATAAGTPGPDTITFAPNLDGGSIALTGVADATHGASALVINDNVTVDATSLSSGLTLTDTGTPASGYRCFRVAAGSSLSLRGLRFSGFTAQSGYAGGGAILNEGAVTLTQCILTGNSASHGGGAINNVVTGTATLAQCTLTGNFGTFGGAIRNEGTVTLTQCTLSGNSATSGGGAIFNNSAGMLTLTHCTLSGNSAPYGGAINNYHNGLVTLTQCSLSGNSASNAGGAIHNHFNGPVTLTQCSLSGNSASNAGGAIFNNSGPVTLTHCTLSGNSATAGGAIFNDAGTPTLHNTIVAGNTASSGPDISNQWLPITADGVNLIGNLAGSTLSAGPRVLVGAAQLAPLGNYGGPTQTMPPLPGSPAIDAAALLSPPLTADQRGFPIRDGDGNGSVLPDIGAAEANAPLVVTTAVDENDTPASGGAGISLREALALAASAPGPDLITFAPGLNGQSIVLSTFTPDPANGASALAIHDATGGVTVDATSLSSGLTLTDTGTPASPYRCFRVAAGSSLTLRGLRLSGFTTQTGSNGGAIRNAGTLTLAQCSLTTNVADYRGGAIYNEGTGTVTLTQCSLSGNSATDGGGAIRNSGDTVTLTHCTLTGNSTSADGGAIYNEGTGTLTLSQCSLSGNSAGYFGGAIFTTGTGTLTLARCSLSTNSAVQGGALFNTATGTMTLTQCSLSGNSASFDGGAIYSGGTLTLAQCSLSTNSASIVGGAVYNFGALTLHNTIVAGNTAVFSGPDIYNQGTITANGVNLIGNLADSTLSQGPTVLTGPAQLAPLGNYGGPTQTMPPLPGSPAIDAAALLSPPLTTDQRGFPIQDGDGNGSALPDIGAAEASIVVTNANDTGPGSLRQALADAAALPGRDWIVFAPGLSGDTINVGSQITIGDSGGVEIDATTLPGGITMSGGGINRIFWVNDFSSVSLRGLSLTGGNANSGPTQTFGGAIRIRPNTTVALDRCTLSGNTATDGGAIFNGGTLTLTRCTIANNSVSAVGGGIYHGGGAAALTLTQCTIAGNAANSYGGVFNNSALTLTDSIIAQNNSANSAPDINIAPSTIRTGVNLIGNLSGSPSSIVPGPTLLVGDARLAPLANYGGLTMTMPPLPGSRALDAAGPSSFTTDQRGLPRPQDNDGDSIATADIGAVEGVHNPYGPGVLAGMTYLSPGKVRFQFTQFNGPGPFRVFAAPEITHPFNTWTYLGLAVESPVGSGEFIFTDPNAASFPRRFYRVVTP